MRKKGLNYEQRQQIVELLVKFAISFNVASPEIDKAQICAIYATELELIYEDAFADIKPESGVKNEN